MFFLCANITLAVLHTLIYYVYGSDFSEKPRKHLTNTIV